MKDCDLLERKEKFYVGEYNKKRIMDIIKKDCTFFIENSIIDYSLLIGVNN